MNLETRLAKIKGSHSGSAPVRDEWKHIELNARAGLGYKMEHLWSYRYAPFAPSPGGRRIVFVDFCPGGVVSSRQDVPWIQQGICTYESMGSEEQRSLFETIAIGDLLIMKKDEAGSKLMRLHAHGRVTRLDVSDEGDRILHVNWSHEHGQMDAPSFGLGKLVCIPDIATIKETMPMSFWRWLRR